jgi:Tfp pilus assembly protein FimT
MRKTWSVGDRAAAGVTLAELLVVVAIIALAVMVAVPAITQAVRSARVRAAVDQFSVTMRAARMVAVTNQSPCDVQVAVDPANRYTYVDARGKTRSVHMPTGVRIVSSTSPITFRPNGSVPGGATTRIETSTGAGAAEVWRIETNELGTTVVTRLAGS